MRPSRDYLFFVFLAAFIALMIVVLLFVDWLADRSSGGYTGTFARYMAETLAWFWDALKHLV